jgi:hypothetical protein
MDRIDAWDRRSAVPRSDGYEMVDRLRIPNACLHGKDGVASNESRSLTLICWRRMTARTFVPGVDDRIHPDDARCVPANTNGNQTGTR